MSDLEQGILRWRRELERQSDLSPREVDELEDHLRVRVELEMELNAGLAPARVFRRVARELGETKTLSREFVKAGRPRWHRLLVAGWVLFAVSAFLPVFEMFTVEYGYQVFRDRWPICLPMILTLWAAWRPKNARRRALVWLNTAAACYLVLVGVDELVRGNITIIIGDTIRKGSFFVGYWTWTASQLLATAGLWLGVRRWRSARTRRGLA